jgi:hypothetical protein
MRRGGRWIDIPCDEGRGDHLADQFDEGARRRRAATSLTQR